MPEETKERTESTVFAIGNDGRLVPLDHEEEAYFEFLRLKRETEILDRANNG